jgi:hypothetical protein
MKTIFKAALFGAVLAAAVFFLHFLIPVLLLLLFFGLIRRALFGPRWRYAAYADYGPQAYGAQRTPTVDGRDWQRSGGSGDAVGHDVHVN